MAPVSARPTLWREPVVTVACSCAEVVVWCVLAEADGTKKIAASTEAAAAATYGRGEVNGSPWGCLPGVTTPGGGCGDLTAGVMLVTWRGLCEAAHMPLTLRGMSTTEMPRGESGPRYVRFQAELVLEIADGEELRAAALSRIETDTFMPLEERVHAEAAVGHDESEALAYLIDPAELVIAVPGVELVQASWSCTPTEYDPAGTGWTPDEEFGENFGDETGDTEDDDRDDLP
jgi:hypothetical protein